MRKLIAISLKTTLLLFFLIILNININAQHLKIKNFSVGYRVFEIDAIGNNPTTIAPFLKNPSSYLNYINSIQYNSIYGSPGIQRLHTYYINTELFKSSPSSRFWKKHTIQTGLLITNKLVKKGLALGNQGYIDLPPDTILYTNLYTLVQKQQFLGVNAGINKRFKISKRLVFLTGIHVQGSFAFIHNYNQQLDSNRFIRPNGRFTKTTHLPDLKGKNFFQWQAMVPLALEFEMYKKQIFIRLEANLGTIGGTFRHGENSGKEAHGAGLWLIYQHK